MKKPITAIKRTHKNIALKPLNDDLAILIIREELKKSTLFLLITIFNKSGNYIIPPDFKNNIRFLKLVLSG